MKSFASSADWIKSLHFSEPMPPAQKGAATDRSTKRRKLGNYSGPEPTVDQIEAEFWRIVEMPDDVSLAIPSRNLALLCVATQRNVNMTAFQCIENKSKLISAQVVRVARHAEFESLQL